MTARLLALMFLVATVSAAVAPFPAGAQEVGEVANTIAIDRVWSGHEAGFDLLTKNGHQYVGYYDANRQMTVAHRRTGGAGWRYTKLPSYVGWDGHNYIEMALDSEGYLHVSGNMHVDPLVYFRSSKPYDVRSLERVNVMVERAAEERMTYPVFFFNKQGRLIFKYRDGSSGNGNEIYNIYDAQARQWRHLLDEPLTDGEGKRNAYFDGPKLGPDGRWHLAWVWRKTPDAATNHDLSYARSDDLVHWKTASGEPLELPITLEESQIVDPVPVGGGIINGNTELGFDHRGRPTITYHKYDEAGNTQIYVARAEGRGTWERYQISDWKEYRWDFGRGGSLPGEGVDVDPVHPASEGRLAVDVSRPGESATWVLDAETMQKVGERLHRMGGLPEGVQREPQVEADVEQAEMHMQYREDSGRSGSPRARYLLSWETLGSNRDRPRSFIPLPSTLKLYRIVQAGRASGAAANDSNATEGDR